MRAGLMVSCICGMAVSANADLPASMDRAPKDALITITIGNIERCFNDIDAVGGPLGFSVQDLGLPINIFELNGLNRQGALTLAAIAPPDFDPTMDEPTFIAIAPVTDFNAFITGLGGEAGEIATFTLEFQELFAKNLGGGYAAISENEEALRAFTGAAGNLAAHRTAVGPTGLAVAESSDIFMTINLPSMRPMIEQGLAGMREQFELMAMMTGQEMNAPLAFFEGMANALKTDGQSMVMGLDGGEHGMSFGLSTQFNPESPTARYFAAEGNAGNLLGKLPAGNPFLAVVAMDFSSPGVQTMLKELAKASQAMAQQQGGMFGGMNLEQMVTMAQGQAFILGKPPALGGGMLFNNTLAFYPTNDPAAYQNMARQALASMNGQTVEGMTTSTIYNPGVATIAGTKVDEWAVRMKFDPNNPDALQVQQIMAFIFGLSGGPTGYSAAVPGGVITTLAKNSALMETAIAATKGQGPTLANDASIRPIAARLPAGRVIEGYIGTHAVIELALELGAMVGGFFDVELPPSIAPIGMGLTARQGGMQVGIVVPMDAIKAFKQISDQVNAGMGEDFDGADAPPPPPPGRF